MKPSRFAVAAGLMLIPAIALANSIPDGSIESITAASTLINMVDSLFFKFGARIMAGLAILAAGWNLKEQRFAMAIVCIFGAIILGTAPMWVANIMAMDSGGGSSVLKFNTGGG